MMRLSDNSKTLPISEVVTGTGRLSPFEDFKKRTLSAVAGLWPKLIYLAELRSQDGRYEHWGHSRVHGEQNSQVALAKIHSELYLEALRAPLRDLMQEVERYDADTSELAVKTLKSMIPANLQGGSPRHLNSVALAVHLLNAGRRASTHSSA